MAATGRWARSTPSHCQPELRGEDAVKAIGYIRVSTDQQAERGISLEAQRERVRAMATIHGAELLDVIV